MGLGMWYTSKRQSVQHGKPNRITWQTKGRGEQKVCPSLTESEKVNSYVRVENAGGGKWGQQWGIPGRRIQCTMVNRV